MRDVATFAGFAQTVTFDRLGEDDRGLTPMFVGSFIGGVHLALIVTAPEQFLQLLVGEVVHQRQQFGILAKEVPARMTARLDRVLLEVAVAALLHPFQKQPGLVLGQQFIPVRAPDHLEDVPAGAPEGGLEFLNDLAVAAHRTIEPLEIAVHDPGQVVEFLARRQGERAERFGFIALAIAHVTINARLGACAQSTRPEVAVEACLIDRQDRTETH